jgi:rhodanese-related sulfurtransferase
VQFIDVRPPEEYRTGHIPNSFNLPYDYARDAGTILEEFSKNSPFVIYSNASDSRMNAAAAEEIFSSGFKRLYIYDGGIDEWINAGYEVVR